MAMPKVRQMGNLMVRRNLQYFWCAGFTYLEKRSSVSPLPYLFVVVDDIQGGRGEQTN